MARNEQREGSDNVRSGARSVRNGRPTLFIGLAALAYYLLILGGHQYSIDGIAMFQAAKTLPGPVPGKAAGRESNPEEVDRLTRLRQPPRDQR